MIAGAVVRRFGSVGAFRWRERADGAVLVEGIGNQVPEPSDVAYLLWRAKMPVPEPSELRARLRVTAEGTLYEPPAAFP